MWFKNTQTDTRPIALLGPIRWYLTDVAAHGVGYLLIHTARRRYELTRRQSATVSNSHAVGQKSVNKCHDAQKADNRVPPGGSGNEFLCFTVFIVQTVQDFCKLSPIQFTPPALYATKLDGVNQAKQDEIMMHSFDPRSLDGHDGELGLITRVFQLPDPRAIVQITGKTHSLSA